MSSAQPDRPDPHTDPEGAVDEMEERTLDDDLRPSPRVDERTDDGTAPAFEVDLDPEDQGRADSGSEQTG